MPSLVDTISAWAQLLIVVAAALGVVIIWLRGGLRALLKLPDPAEVADPQNPWEPFEDISDLRDHIVERFREFKDEIHDDLAGLKVELDRVEELENTIKNGLADRMGAVETKVDRLIEGQARMEGRMGS